MFGSLPIVAFIGCVFGTPKVDSAVIGRVEALAGSAPPAPQTDPEASVALVLEPGIAARIRDPRWTLTLEAAPRIYYRAPNLLDLHRPLYLVGTHDRFEYRVSRRVTWSSLFDGSYGEVDYTSQAVVFGPTAGQVNQSVLRLLSVHGETGLSWLVTRRYTLNVSGAVLHSEPIGSSVQTFPATTSFRLRLEPRYQLDARSSVNFLVSPSENISDPGTNYLGLTAAAGYFRNLSQRTDLATSAGVTAVEPQDAGPSAYPVASLQLTHVSYRRRGLQVTNRFLATYDTPFDPVTGLALPSVSFLASAGGEIGERWAVYASGYAVTAVTRRPTSPDSAETSVLVDAGFRRDLAPGVWLNVGGRYLTRGSHLNAQKFSFFDRQIWAIVGLTFALGLGDTPNGGAWAL